MAQHGLSDRVAIISMGCTRFAEHFDRSADELAIDTEPLVPEPVFRWYREN